MINALAYSERVEDLQHVIDAASRDNAYAIENRVEGLEALRTLVCRWPATPPHIRHSPPLTSETDPAIVVAMEQSLAQWYTQAFWECAGRAASVPRTYPAT